jgi:hypothetical protein
MINTWDETRNHLPNAQWHESQNTQHRYAPTNIVTIMGRQRKPKGTLIQVLISGNRGQVCVMKVPEGSVTGVEIFLFHSFT